jgi:hypothetical protein
MAAIANICLWFIFMYVYGLLCQFLIRSSFSLLVVANIINTNSSSWYFNTTNILPQLVLLIFSGCKQGHVSSGSVFPAHIIRSLLFSTNKFSKCRPTILWYSVQVYYLYINS